MAMKSAFVSLAVEVAHIARLFPTKGECERFMRYTIAQHETQSGDKPWLEKPKDSRKLSELIETWDELHGHFLKDGKRRKAKLNNDSRPTRRPRRLQLNQH